MPATAHKTPAAAVRQARQAVIRAAKNRSPSAGQFTCPVCQNGRRRFSLFGHKQKKIHSTCTSAGCPQIMD